MSQERSANSGATVSLVLGILALVLSAIAILGIPLGIAAIITGAISLKNGNAGRGKAGIILGSSAIVFGIILSAVIFLAIPRLQVDTADTARRNDVARLSASVVEYQMNNTGQLPEADDLSTFSLTKVRYISSSGQAGDETAVYRVGENCDGESSVRAYSITILLADGSEYCQGS